MLYDRLVIPPEMIKDRHQGDGVIMLVQLPFRGSFNERYIYFIKRDLARRNSVDDHPLVNGLELVFIGINQRFIDELSRFADHNTCAVPLKPLYKTSQELLLGFQNYTDIRHQKNLEDSVSVLYKMRRPARVSPVESTPIISKDYPSPPSTDYQVATQTDNPSALASQAESTPIQYEKISKEKPRRQFFSSHYKIPKKFHEKVTRKKPKRKTHKL